jgi:nucleoside-diphosphate-sugar epimerase
MRILFIGGTGNISSAAARLAIEQGFDLTLLNRGTREQIAGARTIHASITDEATVATALGSSKYDAVVNWIAFTPEDIERDLRLLRDRTNQYLFISSASCYKKPVEHYPITENTPLDNLYWDYSRQKIACEERLWQAHAEEHLQVTIVRPSLTYGNTIIPLPTNSWQPYAYTVVDRLQRGAKVVIPGDGTSLWVLTHNTDFAKGLVGLLGNSRALGEAYHITSDEVLTWNQVYDAVADAAGVRPNFIHIASNFIVSCLPEKLGTLIGDKSNSVIFDNNKIKTAVPGFAATTRFKDGIRQTIAWFDERPKRRLIDDAANDRWDRLIAAYEAGLKQATAAM